MSYIKYIESYTTGTKILGVPGSEFNWFDPFCFNNFNNNIYILDRDKYRINCIDTLGNFKYSFNVGGASNIICDNLGYVYVSYTYEYKIKKYTATGDFVFEFGEFGDGDKQFKSPAYMAIDSSNNLYILDNVLNCVKKFNSNGDLIFKFNIPIIPGIGILSNYGIAVNSKGNIYIANNISKIYIYNSDGVVLGYIGTTVGTEDGQLKYPKYVAIDKSDRVYIPTSPNKLSVFNEYNKFLYSFTADNPIEKYRLDILSSSAFIWNICVDNNYNMYLSIAPNYGYDAIYTINYNIEQDVTPYISHLSKLIPYGKCWESKFYTNSIFYNFIKSIAYSIMNLDNTVMGLLKSINIKKSNDFLEEWEKLLGLPKPDFDIASTIEQRKLNVLALIRAGKAYSIQDWKDIANIMGVDITIEQYSESSGRAFPYTFPITFPYSQEESPYLVIITFKNIDMAYTNRSFPYTFPITFQDNEKYKYLEKIYNMIKPVFIKLIFKYQ